MKKQLHLLIIVTTSIFVCLASGLSLGQSNVESVEVEEIEEIRVIGQKFQRSLQDALSEKRDASQIIEALSAEDIGALPDTSVAESLARLPGVSYTRNAFGASNISIRGLGSILTNTTFNGRDLASEWGDRSISYNLFPAEMISRATLYKAPAASQVEGGIGGTVDMGTARALEWGEQSIVVNFRGRYNDLARDLPDAESVGYRASATYIDQFANDTLGVALGYAGQYAPLISASSYVYESRTVNWGGTIDGIPPGFGPDNSFNIPYGGENTVLNGTSDRHSFLGTLQWQPVENFEVNFDGFFSQFKQDATAVGLAQGGLGTWGNTYSDVKTDDFNLIGATVTCLHDDTNACLNRRWGQELSATNGLDDAGSRLHSYGIEGKLNPGRLTLTYDFSWSKADADNTYTNIHHRPYGGTTGRLQLIRPVATFGENEESAAFLTSPLDFADPSTNRIDGVRIIDDTREDEIYTYRLDAEYAIDSSFLTAVKLGLRLVNRDNTLIRRDVRIDPSVGSAMAIAPDVILGVYDQSQADSAFDANPVLVLDTQRVRNTVFAGVAPAIQPLSSHFIEEDVRAYYAQADFQTYVFAGIPASGNIGVRVVTTDVDTEGTSSIEGEASAVATSDKYTEVLPSANINFFPTEDIVVRLAAARVLSRPAVTFLSPGTEKWGETVYGGALGGGNPFLKPFLADQLDLSVERYFDKDSAIAVALFYKEMDTFITQAKVESTSRIGLGRPPQTTISYIPANGDGGRIFGMEITFQSDLNNLLPLRQGDYLGIYATYSYTDSNIKLSETYNSSTFGLDGQSDHVGNVTLHYNRDKFNARVSYRFRTEFTRPQRPARAFTTNRGEGDLAFQTSYDFNDHIRIFVEGYGLLDEARDNYYGQDSLQGSYGVYGRNIQFGATYRF